MSFAGDRLRCQPAGNSSGLASAKSIHLDMSVYPFSLPVFSFNSASRIQPPGSDGMLHAGVEHAVTVRNRREDRVSRYPGLVAWQCFECGRLQDGVAALRLSVQGLRRSPQRSRDLKKDYGSSSSSIILRQELICGELFSGGALCVTLDSFY